MSEVSPHEPAGRPLLEHDDLERLLKSGADSRRRLTQRRSHYGLALSTGITLVWLALVGMTEAWSRVSNHWIAAVTMVAGSVVAGATPQGGGAVAFPVFTKILGVPTAAARTFSLCIQAVGMGSAGLSIILSNRVVEWRAAAVGGISGSIALIATLLIVGDPSRPFWPTSLPGPYVKVTFTIIVASMAWVVFLGSRTPIRTVANEMPPMNGRLWIALGIAGLLGGVASALVGSGSDVFIYLFVVVLFGVRAGVGVPTSVISMAIVSMTGLLILGLLDRQLFVTFGESGQVTAIGGEALVSSLEPRQADLYGMWLAAVPIVAWGAPIGARIAVGFTSRTLVRIVVGLAALELFSTLLFLSELRTDGWLAVYGLCGLAGVIVFLTFVAADRRRLFGLPGLAVSTLLTRTTVETAPNYEEEVL